MSKLDERMKYKVVVRTGISRYEEYKVYSHNLESDCLILNQGTLNCGAREEMVIPVSCFVSYHTEDLD